MIGTTSELRQLQTVARTNPVGFIEETYRLSLWDKQRQIVESVFKNKYTAVRSCYGSGKSKIAAVLTPTFLFAYAPCKVITTATSWEQVDRILWSEINTEYPKIKPYLGGRILKNPPALEITPDCFALGLSPKIDVDGEAVRFEGYHAPRVFVIIDQAQGINQKLWDASKGLMTNDDCRMLVLGNPMNMVGPFYDCFRNELWNKIHISAYDVPNVKEKREVIPGLVSMSYIEDRKKDWGEDAPLFISKVLGEFPPSGINNLISRVLINEAVNRELIQLDQFPTVKITVCDVARYGDDETVIKGMEGGPAGVKTFGVPIIYQKKDTTVTASYCLKHKREHNTEAIVIDGAGVGGGVVDQCRKMGATVIEINSAEKAIDFKRFSNKRAEMHWTAKDIFQDKEVSIENDPKLIEQLASPEYSEVKGRIQIESKDDIKRKIGCSPDRSDVELMGIYVLRNQLVKRKIHGGGYRLKEEVAGVKISGAHGW